MSMFYALECRHWKIGGRTSCKATLSSLARGSDPIPCTYALLPALPSLLEQASVILVGAHAIFANGAVYSQAGIGMVAMTARGKNMPFVVCCELYKSSGSVMIDGLKKKRSW
ncbi:initiation factor 2 subunit family-domain-containing protein [Gymnopilus junonius]|uniref:Translation initiation factor eIF2B subunit delta n=1 Tax=Gymnopilus junonius TaxID=109634 RepID=A0A9P5NX60_GYMJU|nr:initiation factor 2 subunit family-domain-containing protein [Gymnopilus junonius]